MSKGTLVLIPFPFTDLSGHKVRPALVLHNQSGGEDCIVAFITSIKPKKINAYDVLILPTENNGIKSTSVIKVSKIATLQKKIILGELGTIDPQVMVKVDSELKNLFKI